MSNWLILVCTCRWLWNLVLITLLLSPGASRRAGPVIVVARGSVALLWVDLVSAVFWMVFSFDNGTFNNHDCWIPSYCMMNTPQICFCRIEQCAVELPCSFCCQFSPRHLGLVCLNICGVQQNNLVLPNFITIFSFVVTHKVAQGPETKCLTFVMETQKQHKKEKTNTFVVEF